MALSRVVLLLAVGAQILAVSSNDEHGTSDLAQRGEAPPEEMLQDDAKLPTPAEVLSEKIRENQRNSSSRNQQLVPQVEIVYDSSGKGWVDQVKQVPNPATSPSREARRADNPRKDVIGTEIINDVAYLEIRQDKGHKSPPLVTVRHAERSTTTAPKTRNPETTHTGKIHYSQIPYRELPIPSGPASEDVQHHSPGDRVEVSTSTTTTTEKPTEPYLSSEETEAETEASSQEQEHNGPDAGATVGEDVGGEDYGGEVHDYAYEDSSSEDQVDQNVTTNQPQPESVSTSAPTTPIENDYDDDGEHETEGKSETELENTTTISVETSSEEKSPEVVRVEQDVTEAPTQSPTLETSTIRRIPISRITTPSVDFVMPTEAATEPEATPDFATETSVNGDSNEEELGEDVDSAHEPNQSGGESFDEFSENNSTARDSREQSTQSAANFDEISREVGTDWPATTLSPRSEETATETRAADPADVISIDLGLGNNVTTVKQEETTESISSVSNSSNSEVHGTGSHTNSSGSPEISAESGTEMIQETTTSKENLGRELDDDDVAFPTEKSDPTPDFFSQFVTVNPNMFYGIFTTSPRPQPTVKTSGIPLRTITVPSTTTSTTTSPPSTPSTTSQPVPITRASSATPTTPSTFPARASPETDPVPTDPGFVLGLEGLFNLGPSVNPKPSEPARPSNARFGNSFESLKQAAGTTEQAPSSTAIPSFFGDGAPLEMLQFPWNTDDGDFGGPDASLKRGRGGADPTSEPAASTATTTTTTTTSTPLPSSTPVAATTIHSRVNLFSKKIAPTLVPTRAPPSGPPKKFNLFSSLTNANNPMGHKADRRPDLRPLKKVAGPWEPSIEPPEETNPEPHDVDRRPERKALFGTPTFERRLVLEGLPPSTTRRPAPQFHPPTLLHDFAVPPPVNHRNYDMNDFLHRGTPSTPRNAKSPISSKARTTLLMCAAIIGGAAIFFATLMVVCMRRTKNKRLIRRRAIDKFIQDSTSESSSSYGGSHSSYGRKGLLA